MADDPTPPAVDLVADSREAILRRFHDARPGVTSAALAPSGSYHRLAALVPPGARVLDLAAGDGYLSALLAARGARPIAVDVSRGELAAARARGCTSVLARAQALPFAAASFDACVCHLAFMLLDDAPAVVAELARVLAPGGLFAAVLGGGPTADGADAFHRFLELARPHLRGPRFGDPRARSEAGWRALFAGWGPPTFERHELDLSGTFDEVWRFLGASYELPPEAAAPVRAALAAALPGPRVPCRAVTWLAAVRRP